VTSTAPVRPWSERGATQPNPIEVLLYMPAFKLRMRTSAAVLAGAAGLTALGAAVVPAAASAATASPQDLAAQMVPADQLASFSQIISHESGWNVTATNPSSGSYGLGQALPASKMASAGADWKTNPATQIKWALDYMNTRYGSPNAAWSFWQNHHWY
jgi:Transglycosylase SLT domain